MTALLILIAQIIAPAFAELVAAYLRQLAAAVGPKSERDGLAIVAQDIVTGINRTHPEWPNDQKRRYATEALAYHAASRRLDVSDSLINATIELAVVRSKGA